MVINYTTPVGQVRLLIADVNEDSLILADEQVTAYLTIAGEHVKRAAATALDAIATSEVLVSKVIRSQDLQTDGAKVADALRKHAAQLRQEADDEDGEDAVGMFEVAEFHPWPRGGPEAAEAGW
ncbi:hypothetical protein [Occultella kanbiaonis]|uniref:hypothetical protein n=1 Tax=Occultella kanbiaonis TaxID=2675754 RepID=UPI0013CF4EE1|nr:hypothetical protein [Occultella kanbiaonis]